MFERSISSDPQLAQRERIEPWRARLVATREDEALTVASRVVNDRPAFGHQRPPDLDGAVDWASPDWSRSLMADPP